MVFEAVVGGSAVRRFGDGEALVLVIEVILQEVEQIVVVVVDAFAPAGEVGRRLEVPCFLEEQSAGGGRLEHPAVALAPDAAVEDDPRPP